MAYVNWQLRTRPICISLPPLSSNPFNPCSSRSICGKQQESFAGYLCISCAKPLVLVSGLRFLETFRRHPALVFAFAALAPLPARPPGNYGKQNKNSIFSALLQVSRRKLCQKNKNK